jgi:citrate lyase subunit beta/citryl-CoA lyase
VIALRSVLQLSPLRAGVRELATRTAADAVLLDLGGAEAFAARAEARRAARAIVRAAAEAGRGVLLRVSSARSGELIGDLEAVLARESAGAIGGVVVTRSERAQDARDADVAIRRQEVRAGIEPGSVRLVAEVASAAGLRALEAQVAAVDRHGTMLVDAVALAADLGLPAVAGAALEAALVEAGRTAATAELPWLLATPGLGSGARAVLVAFARGAGAGGAVVEFDAEAAGFNALFAPDAARVAAARGVVAAWERRRAHAPELLVDGAIVDARAARRAAALVGAAEAIVARERAG